MVGRGGSFMGSEGFRGNGQILGLRSDEEFSWQMKSGEEFSWQMKISAVNHFCCS